MVVCELDVNSWGFRAVEIRLDSFQAILRGVGGGGCWWSEGKGLNLDLGFLELTVHE
jgi:hypothetical protein